MGERRAVHQREDEPVRDPAPPAPIPRRELVARVDQARVAGLEDPDEALELGLAARDYGWLETARWCADRGLALRADHPELLALRESLVALEAQVDVEADFEAHESLRPPPPLEGWPLSPVELMVAIGCLACVLSLAPPAATPAGWHRFASWCGWAAFLLLPFGAIALRYAALASWGTPQRERLARCGWLILAPYGVLGGFAFAVMVMVERLELRRQSDALAALVLLLLVLTPPALGLLQLVALWRLLTIRRVPDDPHARVAALCYLVAATPGSLGCLAVTLSVWMGGF